MRIIIAVLLCIGILIFLSELAAIKESNYYQGYLRQEFKGTAYDFKCKSSNESDICKHCKYRKNYQKEKV